MGSAFLDPAPEGAEREELAHHTDGEHGRQALPQCGGVPADHDQRPQRGEEVGHRVVRGHGGQPALQLVHGQERRGQEREREEQDEARVHRGGAAGLEGDGVGEAGEDDAPQPGRAAGTRRRRPAR